MRKTVVVEAEGKLPLWATPNPGRDAVRISELLKGEPVEVLAGRAGNYVEVQPSHCSRSGWVTAMFLGDYQNEKWFIGGRDDPATAAIEYYLDAPYLEGGLTRAGIDVPGLVHMGYRHVNKLIPRFLEEMEGAGELLGLDEIEPMDLVTYNGPNGEDNRAYDIAFVLPNNRMLHFDPTGKVGLIKEPPEMVARRRHVLRIPWD